MHLSVPPLVVEQCCRAGVVRKPSTTTTAYRWSSDMLWHIATHLKSLKIDALAIVLSRVTSFFSSVRVPLEWHIHTVLISGASHDTPYSSLYAMAILFHIIPGCSALENVSSLLSVCRRPFSRVLLASRRSFLESPPYQVVVVHR